MGFTERPDHFDQPNPPVIWQKKIKNNNKQSLWEKNLERISKFAKNVWNENLQNNGFKNNVQESCPKR